jgi:signal transduction histidine kinase
MLEAAVRVLLVDDDEDEYVIVGDLLRAACAAAFEERFELTWASTYEQGVQAILAGRCDVCLVDYRLGERSGLDLLAEVTAKSDHPQVILLSGEGDRGVDVTATKAGAADYLIKGELTAASLERSIRYAVERGRILKALREAQQLAESLNLAKSAFVAAMSHEIRNPMNAVLGMADMLWESQLDADQRHYVDVFRRAGAGLLSLINDILDLSKVEAGRLELERVKFDLKDVMDRVIELAAVKARGKDIALLSHLSPGVATSLMGDPTRLSQVLINLLGNAVKFTDSGKIVLSAGNHESGKPGQIEFTVSDTGIGVPPDKLESIFEDFSQADASTTRQYGGTGLGLGISRGIVKAMGGLLTATSSVSKGSTFCFSAQFGAAPENAPKVSAALGNLHGKRVLLIDDEAANSLILQETLRFWGLESDAFRLPAEALARLREAMAGGEPYSLVVVSGSIPGNDGFEAIAKIGRIAGGPPIVTLTSDLRPGDATRRAEAGLPGHTFGPVARAHLLGLVRDALQERERPQLPTGESGERRGRETVKPAKILIAEDSPDNRLLAQAFLKSSPYRLTFEVDGKAAVDRFAASDFDLILMDVGMPVMDGLAATRAIRALERERGADPIPILALTADASLEDIERSSEAGCDAHLSKPISKLELLNAIEKYRRQPKPEMAPGRRSEAIGLDMLAGLKDVLLATKRE